MNNGIVCGYLIRQINFIWERIAKQLLENTDLNWTQLGMIGLLIEAEGNELTLKQLEKLYPDKANDIALLIRSIIGIDEEEVKTRLEEFKQHYTTLNSKQMLCLNLVEKQLKANNYLKETSLYDRPFTGLGDISDIFTKEELEELYKLLDGYMIKERVVG